MSSEEDLKTYFSEIRGLIELLKDIFIDAIIQ